MTPQTCRRGSNKLKSRTAR